MSDTAPLSRPTQPTAPLSKNPRKTILFGSVGILILAIVVYAVSRPEEKFGPAAAPSAQQHSGMPHNHPTISDSMGASDAFKGRAQRITLIEALLDDERTHDVKLHLEMANLLVAQGDETGMRQFYVEAGLAYEAYLVENPTDLDARTSFAYALFKSGLIDQSIAELRHVQRDDPRHQPSSFNLALVYMQSDKRDSVIHFLRHTAAIDSTTEAGRAAVMALKQHDSIHSSVNSTVAD